MTKYLKLGALFAVPLIIAAVYVITYAAQPGVEDDPLVTRRYVDEQISQLADEVALLRSIVANLAPHMLPDTAAAPTPTPPAHTGTPSPLTQEDRDALLAELAAQLGITDPHPPGQTHAGVVPFIVINPQAGQSVIFDEGAEFILRGGGATAITGPYNGIPDITAGADIMNGTQIGINHLMMVPRTDGRGIHFTRESWVMVRGGFTLRE